jgi:DNA helicase-2/ATP-dependent DNA helicase PcrA
MARLIQNPTPDQSNIFAHIAEGTSNLIVQAVAGSGKTSTIVHAMSLLPEGTDAVYLVFNKKNQVEAADRLKGTPVIPYTFNSYGMRALPKGGRWNLDGNKAWTCWRNLSEREGLSKEDDRAYGMFAVKMVSLARANAIGIICADEPAAWQDVADHQDVAPADGASFARGIDLARKLLREMMRAAKTGKLIDFDDQLYLPLHPDFGGNVPRPEWIFVDEAQDLSPVQVEFVARMMGAAPGGEIPQDGAGSDDEDNFESGQKQRCVFVGDRWQAIYGWRGADCDAMDNIQRRFRCAELPLSVCWRCGSDFVALAASLGAPIEAAPGKDTGKLIKWTSEMGSYSAPDGIVVLCRTTAPLVANAYKMIRQGRKAVVLGREIGKGLITLIKQQKANSVNELRTKLEKWAYRECERLEGKEHKQEAIRDRVECILTLAEMLPSDEDTIDALIDRIDRLFADDGSGRGVTFSTIHKAKGLEWDEVVILDAHKMPAAWAKKPWQKRQEIHVAYVAYTRPRESLYLVHSEDFETGEGRGTPTPSGLAMGSV